MNARWIFVLTLVPIFLYAGAAMACSPPIHVNLQSSPYATPDRIAFALSGDIGPPESVEFVVKEKDTLVEIPGTKSLLENSNVVIFTPEVPLTLGGEYMVEFVEWLGEFELFWVEIVEEVPSASITTVTGEIHRAEVDRTSCAIKTGQAWEEAGCEDYCGGDDCYAYWPGGYEYYPGVLIELAASRIPVVIDTFVYEEGNESVEEPRVFSRLGYQNVRLDNRLRHESELGLCVRTVIRDLDNTVLSESRDCVAAEGFPAFEREVPDFPERVALCAEPARNPEDINWQRYGSKSASNEDGGCSTTGSSTGFGLAFLFGLGLHLTARRRRLA